MNAKCAVPPAGLPRVRVPMAQQSEPAPRCLIPVADWSIRKKRVSCWMSIKGQKLQYNCIPTHIAAVYRMPRWYFN